MEQQHNIESANQGLAKGVIKRDHRVILAVHPEDADKIFSSQSSYGENLTIDFRENVKALSQVYIAIQRYLQGVDRKKDSYYPVLEDVHKDLQIYKRSVSDKIPLPTEGELFGQCLQLAAQEPAFIHIIQELNSTTEGEVAFVSNFVAPTLKHDDKVIVAYRSNVDLSIKSLKTIIKEEKYINKYCKEISAINTISNIPITKGRADQIFKRMYLKENDLGSSTTDSDRRNLKIVNQEIQKRCFRPIITQAIKEKLILSLSCESIRKEPFKNASKIYDISLFLSTKYLMNRYSALIRFLSPKYTNGLIEEDTFQDLKNKLATDEIDDFEYNDQLAKELYENATSQPEPDLTIVQVAVEIQKLGEWLNKSNQQNKKEEEVDELQMAIRKIKAYGGLMRAKTSGKFSINEKFLGLMLKGKISPVLACTDPYDDLKNHQGEIDINHYDNIFLIYKDRTITGKAVDTAIAYFEKNEDAYTLHILENLFELGQKPVIQLKEYIAPVYLDKLGYALKKSYIKYLPFFQRLWLGLTSSQISDKKLKQIRNQRRNTSIQNLGLKKGTFLKEKKNKKQVKSMVQERIESSQLSSEEDQAFKNLITYLDNHWSNGTYPSKQLILANAADQSDEYRKLLGLIDAGAASVKDVIEIKNTVESVYAHINFLKEHRNELISYFETKLKGDESTIVHQNRSMVLQKGSDQYKNELFKAILNHLKLRM